MIRDELMQRVVNREDEPITPFIDRIRELYEQYGISTILVAGSSGSYFHVADCIVQMNRYKPQEITAFAKEEADRFPLPEVKPPKQAAPTFERAVRRDRAFKEDARMKLKTMGRDGISINRDTIDVRYVEQLADTEQLAALAYFLKLCRTPCVQRKTHLKGERFPIDAVCGGARTCRGDGEQLCAVRAGQCRGHRRFLHASTVTEESVCRKRNRRT